MLQEGQNYYQDQRNPLFSQIQSGIDTGFRFADGTPQEEESAFIARIFDPERHKNAPIAVVPTEVIDFLTGDIRRYWEHTQNPDIHKMLFRKVIHTQNVMRVSAAIMEVTPQAEWNIPQELTTAALHDIARFPQAFHFQSFRDGESFDHAHVGAERIARSRIPFEELKINEGEIIDAVAEHSAHSLSNEPTLSQRLIRDADKITILMEDIADFSKVRPEQVQKASIRPEAMEQFRKGEVIRNGNAPRLPVDKLIQRLSWIYDINFKASAGYIAKQGIFPKLMKHLSRNVLLNSQEDQLAFVEVAQQVYKWHSKFAQTTS